jgi:hypothetical protein
MVAASLLLGFVQIDEGLTSFNHKLQKQRGHDVSNDLRFAQNLVALGAI